MVALDTNFMTAALQAGRTNMGHTWPNPSVGCVLVKNGAIIATGCTQIGGRPHAEIDALSKTTDARGATAYVTLEPCNHAHKDKPVSCCDGLIAAGIERIVIGMPDPDPRMSGKSIQKFRDAGIQVDVGICEGDILNDLIGYCTRPQLGRPRVTLKLAHARDGSIGVPGTRTAISADASWQRTFFERSRVDAVMVGIGTVETDNPQLTDRRENARAQPIRIVVDRGAKLPLTSRLVQTTDFAPVWLLCSEGAETKALENAGVRIIHCPLAQNKIDLRAAMKILGDIGLNHILCEGGAALAQSLADADLIDEAFIIEGDIEKLDHGLQMPKLNLSLRQTEQIGPDIWRTYTSTKPLIPSG